MESGISLKGFSGTRNFFEHFFMESEISLKGFSGMWNFFELFCGVWNFGTKTHRYR